MATAPRTEGARLRAELRAELRRRDRETLARLRAELDAARVQKRDRLRAVGAACRAQRDELSRRARELRAELAQVRAAEQGRRAGCRFARAEVRAEGGAAVGRGRAKVGAEREHQRALALHEKPREAFGVARVRGASQRRAAERASESDDEVRGNIPPELVPLFERVRRSMRATPRMSRTEAFLHYAEEHPDEAYLAIDEQAAHELARLERAERQHRKTIGRPSRYRGRTADLEHALAAEVPF